MSKPVTATKVDGPWPHVLDGGRVVPREPLGEYGTSRLPVGGECCSMTDLGRLAAGHLRGAQGKGGLLKAETYQRLHAGQPGGGTMSWDVAEVDWAKGRCLWHSGATGDWFCLVHILPDEDYATCVVTNSGGKDCDQACQAVHLELVERVPRVRERVGSAAFLLQDRFPTRP